MKNLIIAIFLAIALILSCKNKTSNKWMELAKENINKAMESLSYKFMLFFLYLWWFTCTIDKFIGGDYGLMTH